MTSETPPVFHTIQASAEPDPPRARCPQSCLPVWSFPLYSNGCRQLCCLHSGHVLTPLRSPQYIHFGVAYIPVRRQLPSVFGVRQAPTALRSVQVNKTHPVSFEDPAGVGNASEVKYFAAASEFSVSMAVHHMPSR